MAIFKDATLGTLFCLAGTALLLLASINVPIIKSLYFLSANINAENADRNEGQTILLGTLGFCVQGGACVGPTLGYTLNADSLLGIYSSYIKLPNELIKWLTYVLILHPIAAGLGAVSSVLGILGHIRELSVVLTLSSTWIAGVASTISLLAFIFDIVVFTIVKSRINAAATTANNVTVSTDAAYGAAIWITLAGFFCFAFSGCCFRFGRRVARERRADKTADAAWRSNRGHNAYAEQEREAAISAENARQKRSDGNNRSSRLERGLPSFAEDQDIADASETLPLRSYDYDAAEFRAHQQQQYTAAGYAQEVSGVGVGYGRRNINDSPQRTARIQPSTSSTDAGFAGVGTAMMAPAASSNIQDRLWAGRPNRQGSNQPEPFIGSMADLRQNTTSPVSVPPHAGQRDAYNVNHLDRPSAMMAASQASAYPPTPNRQATTPHPESNGPTLQHPQIAHLTNLSSWTPDYSGPPAEHGMNAVDTSREQAAAYDSPYDPQRQVHDQSDLYYQESVPPDYATYDGRQTNPYEQVQQHIQGPLRAGGQAQHRGPRNMHNQYQQGPLL